MRSATRVVLAVIVGAAMLALACNAIAAPVAADTPDIKPVTSAACVRRAAQEREQRLRERAAEERTGRLIHRAATRTSKRT